MSPSSELAWARSLVFVALRMLSISNAATPGLLRPWIIKRTERTTAWPSAVQLSTAYAVSQTYYIYVFWSSGLSNESWRLPLLLLHLPWHLWAAQMCLLNVSEAERQKVERDLGDQNQQDKSEAVSNRTPLSWTWKLGFLLPIQSAAAMDAALLLFADGLLEQESMSPGNARSIWSNVAALVFYLLSLGVDWWMFRASRSRVMTASLRQWAESAINVAAIVTLRASIAWLLSSDELPLLPILRCQVRNYAVKRPSDQYISQLVEQWGLWAQLGAVALAVLVFWPLGAYMLITANKEEKAHNMTMKK